MFHVKQETYLYDIIVKTGLVEQDNLEKLITHFRLFKEWSSIINLTGLTDLKDIAESLYLDSIVSSAKIASIIPEVKCIHDVGSGAGFPGLILPLFYQDTTKFFLYESRRKRANFLKSAIREMGLSNVKVLQERVIKSMFVSDMVTSRAALSFESWIDLGSTLVNEGGHVIAYSNADSDNDLEDVTSFLKLYKKIDYELPMSRKKRAVYMFTRM